MNQAKIVAVGGSESVGFLVNVRYIYPGIQ